MEKNTVFIGLGSNVGDAAKNCFRALKYLEQSDNTYIVCKSALYKTEPVGYSNQCWFVNCVVKIKTVLSLVKFFEFTKNVEGEFLYKSPIRWGPREIDIDLLFFNQQHVEYEHLIIPHPMLHKRRFVLQPMAEIEPGFVHPLFDKTILDLLKNVDDSHKITRLRI